MTLRFEQYLASLQTEGDLFAAAIAPEAGCAVSGSADDVHRALWNRDGWNRDGWNRGGWNRDGWNREEVTRVVATGDADVLELFRENVRIRWN